MSSSKFRRSVGGSNCSPNLMGAGCSNRDKIKEPVAPPSPPPEIYDDYLYLDNTFEYKREDDTKFGKAALDNVGNTCAFNVILQALIHTAPLADYFMAKVHENEVNSANTNGTNGELVQAVYDIIRTTWTDVYEIIIPKTINKLFKKLSEPYRKSEQADAHEFFQFIFNLLHEELKRINTAQPRTVQPVGPDQSDNVGKLAWKEEICANDSVLTDLFRGQMRSQLRCLKCGYISFRFDPFNCLLLPTRQVECSLTDCLNDYTEVTNISGFQCSNCNSRTEGMLKTEIDRIPHILVVVLKRYKCERKKMSKLEQMVTFPLKGLDMSRYMTEPTPEAVYELYAKVDHVGTLKSGHYTATVRNRRVMQWFQYDDDKMEEAEEVLLVKPTTYMLFYYNASLHRFNRANPPAVSGAHKPAQRPIKQVYEAHVGKPVQDDSELTKPINWNTKPKATPPIASGPYAQGNYGYEPVGRRRDQPVDVNSFTVRPYSEDRYTTSSTQMAKTPSIIMRNEDPNDFENPRYQPPSAFFGVMEQPTASRSRRQPNRRRGEGNYLERYL